MKMKALTVTFALLAATSAPASSGAQSTEVQFVSFVLDDVQGTWQNLLPAQSSGKQYRHAKLVLLSLGHKTP